LKSIKKIPIDVEEVDNGKLKFLSEDDTEVHISNIMNDYEDINKGKYQNFEDLVFSYAIKVKGSIV
jgi:DNA/RNA endonuclease G (NUC1)